MARNDYIEDRSDADELIAEFGQDGVLRRRVTTGPTYDPTEGASVDHAVIFVVLGFSNYEVDGTRILATDKKVYLAAGSLSVEPRLDDLLVIGGVVHRIIQVKPLAPSGTVVLWELQVRA